MIYYGVQFRYFNKINEEKAISFLKELSELGYSGYLEEFEENKEEDTDYTFSEWLYNFEQNGCHGFASFVKEIIEKVEKVNIDCDTTGVHDYLGLRLDTPWSYNAKTKNIAKEEYDGILKKYLNKISDNIFEIKCWSI